MTDNQAKSCITCPQHIMKANAGLLLGRDTEFDSCRKYGFPTSLPSLSEEANTALKLKLGGPCSSHGEPISPKTPRATYLPLYFPDVERRTLASAADPASNVRSCSGCIHLIPEQEVAPVTGVRAAVCAARGNLVLSSDMTRIAPGCEFRFAKNAITNTSFQPPRLEDLEYLPEYQSVINDHHRAKKKRDGFKIELVDTNNILEPSEYETDGIVTEEHKASGIRAWRAVIDDAGHEVMLPIYDKNFFSEEVQQLIPQTGDDTHPELYVDHFLAVYTAGVCWTELNETPAVWGEPGTGKTELFRHLAWLMQLPFFRISITSSTELDDLAGKMMFSPEKGTYFQFGRLPKAWIQPGVICIDEPNTGPPAVWQFLWPLTDNSKQMVLDTNNGVPLDRHVDSYLGLAMNPNWDIRNVGTEQMGDADVNRLYHIFVELPPKEVEESIISNRMRLDGKELSKKQMRALMGVAADLRELCKQGTLPITWALRPQIKVARALPWFDPQTAYKRAVGDYLEPSVNEILLDVVKSHFA